MSSARRMRVCAVLALCVAAVAVVPSVQASRAPTRAEAAAIRAAAVGALHGGGWTATGIRVSTVPTADAYAKAAVESTATGVGGEMILRRHAGRWSELFLGTSEFCRARAPRAVLDDLGFRCGPNPRLRLSHGTVARGGRVTITGMDFRVNESVWLGIGPPQSEAKKFGSTRADAVGGFRSTLKLARSAALGRWVILACQRSCRVKAGANIRIVAG